MFPGYLVLESRLVLFYVKDPLMYLHILRVLDIFLREKEYVLQIWEMGCRIVSWTTYHFPNYFTNSLNFSVIPIVLPG